MKPMNTLSRPRYFICKMSLLSVISLALLVTSISPVMANTVSFTRKENEAISKGKVIATECLKPKTSPKSIGKSSPNTNTNTLNTLFTCSAFTKTINTAQQNKVAAFPLVIPAALTAKEAALLAVSAAVTACKINKDCSKNTTQILNELLSLGSTLLKFTGTKLADFKQHVNDLWNNSKDSGIILPQFLQSKKEENNAEKERRKKITDQNRAYKEKVKAEQERRKAERKEEKARKASEAEAARQQAINDYTNLQSSVKELLTKLKNVKKSISSKQGTRFTEVLDKVNKEIKKLETYLNHRSSSNAKPTNMNNKDILNNYVKPASDTLNEANKLLNNQ